MSTAKSTSDDDLRWIRAPASSNPEFRPSVFPETMSTTKPNVDSELRWVRAPALDNPSFQPYVFPETILEKAKRKTLANPIVPIGVLATSAALGYGLISMRRGNSVMSQYMMRARVAAQGLTIVALVLGVYWGAK
ncbi:HIG1 domain family member 2A, mitochondrial-like [Paramacrobiotus metropolitanus]|uniref:HIG1 domain family member 2A, mitochondrial-like n=1 Tax=Paramacrobiotus metropolitanus TaxID=2943436 RepID=UPI0024462EB0|nr:HIG1 domain family member 2A, mitochondrial-like [Paramacrobiotus metropolitanus]